MTIKISSTDSLVLFKNSQGIEARGTLLHLNRKMAIFEVYNPYSIVQLSEVLQDFRIIRGERAIYNGRAVISNLVSTGIMVICSVSLQDSWAELSGLLPGKGLRQEIEQLVSEWKANKNLDPQYQLVVNNFKVFLEEMNRLINQVDMAAEDQGCSGSKDFEERLFKEIEKPLVPQLKELFAELEDKARRIPKDEVSVHKTLAQRELHPFLLCSPFIHRTYSKPLGYAGDYIMVEMMLGDPLIGPNTYAKMINYVSLQQNTVQAHRNRIDILYDLLKKEAKRSYCLGKGFKVMNLGCGPASEIERFIKKEGLSGQCDFHLIDFNLETIVYTRKKLEQAARESGRKINLQFIHKSIHELLKEVAKQGHTISTQSFDMIYCAGLFDYLSDRVCKRLIRLLYDLLVPGGLLILTNVHPISPIRYFMEHIVDWYLIYRNEKEMLSLYNGIDSPLVYSDKTGINVFLEIRKEHSNIGRTYR